MADAIKTLSERAEKVELKLDSLNHINKTMYDWHDKSDEDGVKIWYVRRSLEEALQELETTKGNNSDTFKFTLALHPIVLPS